MRYARLKIFQALVPKSMVTPIYDIYLGRRVNMTKHISIDEHNEFHQIIEMLRRAADRGLIHSLYVDRREYKVKALSKYGEWSVNLTPHTRGSEDSA